LVSFLSQAWFPTSDIHVSNKETKTFFCNISYKTRAILMKFGTPFPE